MINPQESSELNRHGRRKQKWQEEHSEQITKREIEKIMVIQKRREKMKLQGRKPVKVEPPKP